MSSNKKNKIIWDEARCAGFRPCTWDCLRDDEASRDAPLCRQCLVRKPPPLFSLDPQEMVAVQINGKHIRFKKGTLLIDAIRTAGFAVPSLCYHPVLPPEGACRLCIVELADRDNMRVVTSCNFEIHAELSVQTDTPRILELRAKIIDLLLTEAVTSKRIAEMAARYGRFESVCRGASSNEVFLQKSKKKPECVLCGRCVRLSTYVTECRAIEMCGRAADLRPAHAFDAEIDPRCRSCGACAAICPTGAMTKPTNALSTEATCDMCLRICPDRALTRNETTGAIEIIEERCKECGLCIHYCPTEALRYIGFRDR